MGINFIVLLRNRFLHAVLLLLSCTAFYSCSEPSSPFGQTEITLTALDASCTEVWLELKFNNLTQPADIAIQKDGIDYKLLLGLNRDTLLIFEDLNPSQTYAFRAIIRHEGKNDKISNTASVKMMDTTSHNFTWQTWTFGAGGATSLLYDVAIINKNDIWAVGTIYVNDTLYNAVHWNGIDWQLYKVPFVYNGIVSTPHIYSVFNTEDNSIIFGIGVMVIYKDSVFTQIFPSESTFQSRINKLYAESLNDVYIAGNYGMLAHYNGSEWRKIQTSPLVQTMRIFDIWSYKGTDYVLAVASNFPQGNTSVLIKINKNSLHTEEIFPETAGKSVISCWFLNNKKTFLSGGGIFQSSNLRGIWSRFPSDQLTYKLRIRGTSLNEVYATDGFGYLSYFNGIRVRDIEYSPAEGNQYSLDIKDGVIGVVGTSSNRAIISLIYKKE